MENEAECKEIFKKETAGIMNKLLEGVVESGTAKSISLKEIVDAAGKTGTSGGGKDKIFVGYTPYFTAGIWCGFKNEKRSVQFQGSRHLNIWNEICTEICEELNIDEESRGFSINGLKYLPFCKDSGQIFGENCIKDPRGERMEFGYFTLDNAPSAICERHVRVKYDTVSESIACEDCPLNDLLEISLINVTERSFPYEILVSDAEFVYRELREECRVPETENVPYFYFALPDGVYVGKSKGKKQFNRACLIHQG